MQKEHLIYFSFFVTHHKHFLNKFAIGYEALKSTINAYC